MISTQERVHRNITNMCLIKHQFKILDGTGNYLCDDNRFNDFVGKEHVR